jgi:hypothetical protein
MERFFAFKSVKGSKPLCSFRLLTPALGLGLENLVNDGLQPNYKCLNRTLLIDNFCSSL